MSNNIDFLIKSTVAGDFRTPSSILTSSSRITKSSILDFWWSPSLALGVNSFLNTYSWKKVDTSCLIYTFLEVARMKQFVTFSKIMAFLWKMKQCAAGSVQYLSINEVFLKGNQN